MRIKFKQGACLVVTARNLPDYILVIERKVRDHVVYSLPGGKRELGESNVTNAVRETFEETGIQIDEKDTVALYSGICAGVGETSYWVTTYWAQVDELPTTFKPLEKDMVVHVVPIEEFAECNAFPSYNYEVLARLAQLRVDY